MMKLEPLSGPIEEATFRARFSEMITRAEAGEDIVVMREGKPVATVTEHASGKQRKLGLLTEHMTPEERDAFMAGIDDPLPQDEQRILEGEGTDAYGIWRGLPEDRERDSLHVPGHHEDL